jgi:hypothetical protein
MKRRTPSKAKEQKAEQQQLDIELERLEIEKLKASTEQQKLELERERFQFEKQKAPPGLTKIIAIAGAFLGLLTVMITAIVGGGNVWVTKINKDREIALSAQQKQAEMQKLEAQQNREWSLSLAHFVLTHKKALFSGTPEEQRLLAKVVPTIFPPEISVTLFQKLEKTGTPTARVIWRQARTSVETTQGPQLETAVAKAEPEREVRQPETIKMASPAWYTSALTTQDILNGLSSTGSTPKFTPVSSASLLSLGGVRLSEAEIEQSLSAIPGVVGTGSAARQGSSYTPAVWNEKGGLALSLDPSREEPQYLRAKYELPLSVADVSVDASKLLTNISVQTKNPDADSNAFPSLLSVTAPVVSSKLSISGLVIDFETGKPVSNALVVITSGLQTISSTVDAFGSFMVEARLSYAPLAVIRVRVTADGYQAVTKEVMATNYAVTSLGSIHMKKDDIQ